MRTTYLSVLVISIISIAHGLTAQDYRSKTGKILRGQVIAEAEWALKHGLQVQGIY